MELDAVRKLFINETVRQDRAATPEELERERRFKDLGSRFSSLVETYVPIYLEADEPFSLKKQILRYFPESQADAGDDMFLSLTAEYTTDEHGDNPEFSSLKAHWRTFSNPFGLEEGIHRGRALHEVPETAERQLTYLEQSIAALETNSTMSYDEASELHHNG